MTDFFTLLSPGISPAQRGKADGNNAALSPTLHNRKSHRGKVPNVKALAIPLHCGGIPRLEGQSISYCPAPKPGYSPAIRVGGGVDTND